MHSKPPIDNLFGFSLPFPMTLAQIYTRIAAGVAFIAALFVVAPRLEALTGVPRFVWLLAIVFVAQMASIMWQSKRRTVARGGRHDRA